MSEHLKAVPKPPPHVQPQSHAKEAQTESKRQLSVPERSPRSAHTKDTVSTVRQQTDIPPSEYLKMLLVGKPKSAGKTTFALSVPGTVLVLQYDLGLVPRVPGVDPDTVYVVNYPVADVPILENTDQWKRPRNVGGRIIKDAEEIKNAFLEKRPIQIGGKEIPLPDTILADGMTELQAVALDWVLSVNNVTQPEEFSNRYAAWGKRLHFLRTLTNMLIPLPCTVIFTAWEAAEEVAVPGQPGQSKATGKFLPDIGGKLDNALSGKVDIVLRCYAEYGSDRARYFVQCQPDGLREYIGARGYYGLPKKVDVTIDGKDTRLPFVRVFGGAA